MYMDSGVTKEVRNLSAAWFQVAAVVSAVDSTLGKWLTDNYGIGLSDYRAILHLSRAKDRELRVTELTHKVGLNQSSVTRLVGRLETKEMVFRDTCPDDGRGVYAVITDRGIEAVSEIREPFETKICELLQNAAKEYPHLDLAHLDYSFESVGKLVF